jgi:hypothetical protein
MPERADINDTELWTVRTTRRQRFGEDREIELQIADSEIRLAPSDSEPTPCQALYRPEGGRRSVIFKAGERNYRSQFFYKPYRHRFSSGARELDAPAECVVATLQAQTDCEAQAAGEIKTARR